LINSTIKISPGRGEDITIPRGINDDISKYCLSAGLAFKDDSLNAIPFNNSAGAP
jgi:hypothetical protein